MDAVMEEYGGHPLRQFIGKTTAHVTCLSSLWSHVLQGAQHRYQDILASGWSKPSSGPGTAFLVSRTCT